MRAIREHFDDLHFAEACMGKPFIQDRTVSISVQGLLTTRGHPLSAEGAGLMRGRLVFCGVALSRRTLTEYIGDPRNPDGFKDDYVVEDLVPVEVQDNVFRLYSFEGLLLDPVAWVDWDIEAVSFEMIVYDMGSIDRLYY